MQANPVTMTRPDRIIPVAKISEGLRLIDQNMMDFLADSQVLLSKGHDSHAVALAIYAFEELGKYSVLQRLEKEATKKAEATITIKDELFRSHLYKQAVAKELVSQEAMVLVPAYFDERYFDPKYFQTTNITVEPKLRSECAFVDWIDDDWRIGIGTTCDAKRLTEFLKSLQDALDMLKSHT